MSLPVVASVNVGAARTVRERPRLVSAIDKLPVHGPVPVFGSALQGDQVGSASRHGGTARAVHAYGLEDLEWWSTELGRRIRPGFFGENLTTCGLDLNECVIGEQWLVGTARLQVTSVRTPGATFAQWMGLHGVDERDWPRRFVARGRPGVFLAVLDEGWVQEEDRVELLERPGHGVTASAMFRALTTEPALLPCLLELDGLPLHVYETAQAYVDAHR